MSEITALERVMSECLPRQGLVALDTSAMRWDDRQGPISIRNMQGYKSLMLEYIRNNENIVAASSIVNELEEGLATLKKDYKLGPNKEELIKLESQIIWHLKRRRFGQEWRSCKEFLTFVNDFRHLSKLFKISPADYTAVAETLYHAIKNYNKPVSFLTNDIGMSRAMEYWCHRIDQNNVAVRRIFLEREVLVPGQGLVQHGAIDQVA